MDFALTLSAALTGDFIWLPEQTGCYRILESGIIQSGRRKGAHWVQDIYRYYAGLVMTGRCKPLSLGQHIHYTILILINALNKKDVQLINNTLNYEITVLDVDIKIVLTLLSFQDIVI